MRQKIPILNLNMNIHSMIQGANFAIFSSPGISAVPCRNVNNNIETANDYQIISVRKRSGPWTESEEDEL